MFEKFEKVGKVFRAMITIQKHYILAANLIATELFKFREFKFAVLFYDREHKRVGIKLTNDKNEKGVIKIRIREKVGALLSIKSFIDYYQLDAYRSKTFEAFWDPKVKMIIFDLQ